MICYAISRGDDSARKSSSKTREPKALLFQVRGRRKGWRNWEKKKNNGNTYGANHLATRQWETTFGRSISDIAIYVFPLSRFRRYAAINVQEKEAGRIFGRNLPSLRVCLQESVRIGDRYLVGGSLRDT